MAPRSTVNLSALGLTLVPMAYRDDPVGFEQRLMAKLQPATIRSTLAFVSLYQITHQTIKHAVHDKVREFYCGDTNLGGPPTAEELDQYQRNVLSLAPNRFDASLMWLVQSHAITQDQADRLNAFYSHRHSLI